MTRTPHVSLDFKKLSIPEKVIFGNNVKTQLGANVATFATPDVTTTVLGTVTLALQTAAQAAESGDHEKVAAMHLAEKNWNTTFTTEAHYVDRIAVGNNDTILLSGFHATKSVTTPKTPAGAPANVKASASPSVPGAAHVQCDVLSDADSYIYVFSTTPDPVMVSAGMLSVAANPTVVGIVMDEHNKIDPAGLPSRQTLFVTVIGLNSKGLGAAHAPVSFRTL